MAKKGNLFLLIKSLSKSEKRYFKLYMANGKSDANYLQLFEAIDKQVQFDEEAVRNKFKGKAFTSQLHVAKIYLSELILKSLRNYHANDSVNGQILDLIRDAEILYAKELYSASLLKVEKAEKLALRFEKIALLLEVLQWKRKLLISQSHAGGEMINSILEREKETLGKLLNLQAYWHKTHNLFEEVQRKTFVKDLNIKMASSVQAMGLHRHLLYSFYFMNGQLQKAENEITRLIEYLERDPLRIEDDPGSYVTAISNKIGLLLAQKRWSEIEVLIKEMRNVPAKYKLTSQSKFTVRLWLRIFNLELEVYRDTRQLAKGIVLIREVEAFLNTHKNNIPDNYSIMLYYQIACIYFLKENYSKSLQWVNEIVNTNFGETRTELQCYARILNLMVHFELNNIIVLRYAVDSCRRFFKKKKRINPFEQQILLLFSRLSLVTSKEYKEIFKRSFNDIYGKKMDGSEKIQDYIDLESWINKRVAGKI